MEILSEDHRLIADAAAGFLRDGYSIETFRALRDSGEDRSKATCAAFSDMGWTGILVPEDLGGVDMGFRAAGLIAEELGRNLTVSPFLSSAVMAATVLRAIEGGISAGWSKLIAAGTAVIALATEECSKHRPDRVTTQLHETPDGFRLSGRKVFVVDGGIADRLVVTAKRDNKLCLVLLDPELAGVSRLPQLTLDSRNAATVVLEDVVVTPEAILATGVLAESAFAAALTAGRSVAAAEQLGVAKAAAEQTYEYLRTRKQFGVLIGQFQALQHRATDLYCELAQASSLVAQALKALDVGDPRAEMLSRAAKAKMARVGRQATEEAVQMHGGIGMTDDMDLGLFMKRDRVLTEFLGDAGHHTEWLLRQRGI